MFSYTDDAIVTSSPTGRHLSTVIRRPAGMPDDQWRKHADQVCKVLNELDRKAKASSLSLHLQTVGRVKRDTPYEEFCRNEGLGPGEVRSHYVFVEANGKTAKEMYADTLAAARIAELEKQLDHATTKLADSQVLLENPIEFNALQLQLLYHCGVGNTLEFQNRTFKRVE